MKWKIFALLIIGTLVYSNAYADNDFFNTTNETVIPTTATHNVLGVVTGYVNESDNNFTVVNGAVNDYVNFTTWNRTLGDRETVTDLWFACELDRATNNANLYLDYWNTTISDWTNCLTIADVPAGTHYCNLYDEGVNTSSQYNTLVTRCRGSGKDFDLDYAFLLLSSSFQKYNSSLVNHTYLETPATLHINVDYADVNNTTIVNDTPTGNVVTGILGDGITNYTMYYHAGLDHYSYDLTWRSGNVTNLFYFNSTFYDDAYLNDTLSVPVLPTQLDDVTVTGYNGQVNLSIDISFNNTEREVYFGNVPNYTNGINVTAYVNATYENGTSYIFPVNWTESFRNSTHYEGVWGGVYNEIFYGNWSYIIYIEGEGIENQTYNGTFFNKMATALDVDYQFEPFFIVGSPNLIDANYSVLDTALPVPNSTCEITATDRYNVSESLNMTYNNTTSTHQVYFTPDISGLWNMHIYCHDTIYDDKVEERTFDSTPYASDPEIVSVQLWEDKNMSTRYIDEFSFIVAELLDDDVKCYGFDNFQDHCFHSVAYTNGFGNLTLFVDDANYSFYYISGRITLQDYFAQPRTEKFNDFVYLGSFQVSLHNPQETEIHLLVNPYEIDFWGNALAIAKTWGVTVLVIILIITFGIMMFKISGSAGLVGVILSVLLSLWAKMRGLI